MKTNLNDALSTAAVLIAALLVAGSCAYVRGYADGGSKRLRSTCNLENVAGLKPDWYLLNVD